MERTLTYEEKIRKAEEIYARRNRDRVGNITRVNIRENKKKSALKKMLIQMLVCLGMYSIFYLINTTDNIFSEDIKGNTKQILAYDIDLVKTYKDISQYIQGFFNNENESEEEGEKEEQINQTIENIQETQEQEGTNLVEQVQQEETPLSQMEIDANEIKQNYSLIKPLEGVISSEFGEREVNNDLITPEHYGIDIAADEGTEIAAAMEGEVVAATSSSSYRKFHKNSK